MNMRANDIEFAYDRTSTLRLKSAIRMGARLTLKADVASTHALEKRWAQNESFSSAWRADQQISDLD